MATDFFVAAFFIPILIVVVFLVAFRLFAKKKWMNATFFGIRWGQLLSGLIGSLIGLYVHAALMSYAEALDRIAQYESLQDEGALSLTFRWSIYLFTLFAPFFLAAFVVFITPVLAILSKLRLISALGILLMATIIVLANAGLTVANPSNDWCAANQVLCARMKVAETLSFVAPIVIGFIVGARLPILVSKGSTT